MREIEVAKIDYVVKKVLTKVGVPSADIAIIADSIIFAHMTGKGTHGITRLPIYVKKIRNGSLNPASDFKLVQDKSAMAVLDANHGFGQVAAMQALEIATAKSDQFGVGLVGVRNSNNFGTAAFFLDKIVQKNKIGLILANSAPAIAPWGGSKALFGTNPIGFGFPVRDGAPIILDMATSFAARGKIRLAAKNKEKIPFGWALDKDGNPTDDPDEALKGTLIPIGEHKGSGLSLIVDILAGLLVGAAFAGQVKPLNTDGDFSGNGHFIMAIDVDFFMNYDIYLDRIMFLINEYKKSDSSGHVLYPGENAYNNKVKNQGHVLLGKKPIEEINRLLRELALDCKL